MVGLSSLRLKRGAPHAGAALLDAPASASDVAFSVADKHSARVRLLRKAIPMACMGAVVLAVASQFLNPFRQVEVDVGVSSVALQGSKLTMEQPKVSGFKKDAKAYEVVADSAVQDIKKPNIIELNRPVARVEMSKGSWARMSALTGVYDSSTDLLLVKDKVHMKTDSGLEMHLLSASIEMKKGSLVSDQPVHVILPNGWVKSARLSVIDSGNAAIFEGGVTSEFTDAEPPVPATQAAPKS